MIKKRLAFISANNYKEPYPVYPLGISYLTTYISEKMPFCDILLFDFNLNGSYDELGEWILKGEFDIVAISMRNVDDIDSRSRGCFIDHYAKVVKVVKEHSNAPVIIGGPGFSIFPKTLLNRLGADFGIQGEGELSLCSLLENIFHGEDPREVEGLVYREKNEEIKINPRRTYIDSASVKMHGPSVPFYFEKGGMLNIQTKRGCPFNCIYCSYPTIDGRRIRTLNPKIVVDNIRNMYDNYGIDYLFFTDSIFNIEAEYNRILCSEIIRSGVPLKWGGYFNPRGLTEKDLELYARSGLTHIEWGTDTLADNTLKTYKKGFTWDQIRTAHYWANNLNIYQAHFMILGGYGETEETLNETFARSTELKSTLFFPYIGMRIYPGTELALVAIKEGVITETDNLMEPVFYISKNIDTSALEKKSMQAGSHWIFPGMEDKKVISILRSRHHRGPLWEYLRFTE